MRIARQVFDGCKQRPVLVIGCGRLQHYGRDAVCVQQSEGLLPLSASENKVVATQFLLVEFKHWEITFYIDCLRCRLRSKYLREVAYNVGSEGLYSRLTYISPVTGGKTIVNNMLQPER